MSSAKDWLETIMVGAATTIISVAKKVLSRQTQKVSLPRQKTCSVATKDVFCRDERRVLSRQKLPPMIGERASFDQRGERCRVKTEEDTQDRELGPVGHQTKHPQVLNSGHWQSQTESYQ